MPNPTMVTQNIKRTVQEHLEAAGLGAPLLFDDTKKPLPETPAWVDVKWMKLTETDLGGGEGQARWNLFLDCWSWLATDPMGGIVDGLADTLRAAVRHVSVPLLDYADPDAPVATPYFIRLKIDGDDAIPPDDRMRGRSLTVAVSWLQRP